MFALVVAFVAAASLAICSNLDIMSFSFVWDDDDHRCVAICFGVDGAMTSIISGRLFCIWCCWVVSFVVVDDDVVVLYVAIAVGTGG